MGEGARIFLSLLLATVWMYNFTILQNIMWHRHYKYKIFEEIYGKKE